MTKQSHFKKQVSHLKEYSNDYWIERAYLPEYNTNILHLLGYGESLCHGGCKHSFDHTYWSLQLVTGGHATVMYKRTKSPLSVGDFLLVKPNCTYTIQVPPNVEFHRRSLLVSNGMTMNLLCGKGILESRCVIHLMHPEKIAQYYDEVRKIILEPFERTNVYTLSSCIYQVIMEMWNQTNQQFPVTQNFQMLLKNMAANPAADHSIESMAKAMAMSPRSLTRLFQEKTHCSPIKYLLNLRLEMAITMLQVTENETIQDIAGQCGFKSPSYFIRQFKLHTGMTPTAFHKQYIDQMNS